MSGDVIVLRHPDGPGEIRIVLPMDAALVGGVLADLAARGLELVESTAPAGWSLQQRFLVELAGRSDGEARLTSRPTEVAVDGALALNHRTASAMADAGFVEWAGSGLVRITGMGRAEAARLREELV